MRNVPSLPSGTESDRGKSLAITVSQHIQETVPLVTRRAREALRDQRETARRALLQQQGEFFAATHEYEAVARQNRVSALDNEISAGHCAGPAAAAGIKDASWDVVMCEVNGAVIEPPEDGDQETKDFWKQHNELGKKLQHLLGEIGAQAAKRRKVNLASRRGGRRIFDQSADDEEVLSSAECISICLPTLHVGVVLRRNSFFIKVITIMLCHLLSRIKFVNEIRMWSLFELVGREGFALRHHPASL